jgi:mono/diheme cytochrome c family protein
MSNDRLPRAWVLAGALLAVPVMATIGAIAQTPSSPSPGAATEVTFTRDIAPILQNHCQRCHHADGGAPMALTTFDEVRPYAKSMKARTGLRWTRGAMPPFFLEKNIGIQKFKNDPSLNDEEVAKIAKWADNGAPQGNPADMPAPLHFDDSQNWTIGTPDLVLKGPEVLMPPVGPDMWTNLGLVPTGLAEDRYVSAVEVREINDVPKAGATKTVGGRFVFHHMTYTSVAQGERPSGADEGSTSSWPIHEVGRNADIFPPEAGRLLAANSSLSLSAGHLHSNGRETKAHLEFAFKFFPKGYKPLYRRSNMSLGNGNDIDVKPNQANQELHAYTVLQENTKIIAFEPHLHATGVRMCEEAIWGMNIQQLNCVGYDHNWVTQYEYADDAAPLLPKGTIVHLTGFLDTTPANKNLADARNWSGAGRRSVANMFIDLGYAVSLTDDQFQAEMAKRRQNMKSRNEYDIGCPLCWAPPAPQRPVSTAQQQGNQ